MQHSKEDLGRLMQTPEMSVLSKNVSVLSLQLVISAIERNVNIFKQCSQSSFGEFWIPPEFCSNNHLLFLLCCELNRVLPKFIR